MKLIHSLIFGELQVTHPGIPSLKPKGRRLLAFTLVELIVVITILAILGTIAFISLQGYSSASRDSVRISDVGNIVKMLELQRVVGEKVPKPEESIELTASGILIAYQGVAGEKTLGILGVSNGGKDPLENTYYTYTTNANLTKYQIIGFLEDGGQVGVNFGKNEVSAKDLSNRKIYIKGDELGTLLEGTTSNPADRLGEDIDVLNTTEEYKAVFTDDITVTGTGGDLFSDYYNRSTELLNNDELAKFDENLVLYMDMESTTNSGSSIVLKDLSNYGNNGTCYQSGVIVDCGDVGGPQFKELGMTFLTGSYIAVENDNSLIGDLGKLGVDYTVFVKTKVGTYKSGTYLMLLEKLYSTSDTIYPLLFYYRDSGEEYLRCFIKSGDTKSFGYTSGLSEYVSLTSVIDRKNSKWKFYSDGNLYKYASLTDFGDSSNTQDLIIGNNNRSNQIANWYGIIDEIRIYNRVLNENEIKTLYESTR